MTVRIGFIGPLSGGPAAKGRGGRNSAMLAVSQRNADPAARHRYELVVADDACDPAVGTRVAAEMAADRSIAGGITHYCSQVALACVELYHRHAFPVIVWGAHAAEITDANDYPEIHRVSGTFANEDGAAARFMRSRGCRSWAILHDPTDYGSGHAESLRQQIAAHGGEVHATFALAVDQQDLRYELAQLRELAVDAVFLASAPSAWWTTHGDHVSLRRPPTDTPGWMPAPACFARQAAKAGLRAMLHFPASVLRDARVLDDMGTAGEGVLAFEEGAPLEALPGGRAFDAAYRAAGFAEPPEAFGPFAYAAATLLMDVIEAVGSERAAVREALNRVRGHPSLVGPVTFDAKGQNTSLIVSTYVAEGGAWTLWQRSRKGEST